jgi:hypothetical protein
MFALDITALALADIVANATSASEFCCVFLSPYIRKLHPISNLRFQHASATFCFPRHYLREQLVLDCPQQPVFAVSCRMVQ